MNKNNFALIMAGGVGSRFWPVSRTEFPKQFIDFFGVGKTLIQSTYERFLRICPPENIFIVTNEIYIDLINEQLGGLSSNQIMAEPMMRNTAACVAYGAAKISRINPDAVIIVAPSDHTIAKPDAFISAIDASLKAASHSDCLITLGIKPSRPDTGYGYIQFSEIKLNSSEELFKVQMFTEKPDLERAKSFLQTGNFLWNAGIFIWSVKSIQNALNKYLPEMYSLFNSGESSFNTSDERNFIKEAYKECDSISIDIAVMEKANNVFVLPVEFGWSDLGTWASIYEMADKDEVGNALAPSKQVKMINSSNCMVSVPKDKLVILQGLNNFIVVESNNTLMICPRAEEQSVKQIVADVKQEFGEAFI